MGSAARIANYSAAGVAQLIGMYSKLRGALTPLLPVILAITPNTGTTAGGTLFRITGYNFENVSSVTVGGNPATGLIIGGGIITGYTPAALAAGAADVVVRGPAGPTTFTQGFTYVIPALSPTLASSNYLQVDPAGGGQSIVLTGTNLLGATVIYDATPVTPSSTTSTTVTFVAPAHAAGSFNVTATTAGGTTLPLAFTAWSPTQAANIDFVLDANKGVTASGGLVSAWTDQSSNAVAFSQGTGANQPTQTASDFGTLSGMTCDGARFLTCTRRTYTSGLSLFFAAKWTSARNTSTDTHNPPLTMAGDNGSAIVEWGASAGVLDDQVFDGGGPHFYTAGSSLNDGTVRLCGSTLDTSGNLKFYVGMSQQGATQTANWDAGGNSTTLNVVLGGFIAPDDGWIGDVGAIVVINGVIAAGDLTKLNAWSQQRWGTP